MAFALLLALQGAAAPAPPAVAPLDFDLAELARRQANEPGGCGPGPAGEILVCGRRPGNGDYPLEQWERVFREKPLVAEIGIGGGNTARAYTEQVDFGNGHVSKRIMVGVKLPF
jgi:hypothetical protein